MWRVYPSFLQLTFPPLLTALAIQKAQKHVTTQTNDGNPPSPQRHTEGEGTHLVELSAHLLGLELLQEVPVLDGVQGHDLRAPPLPVIPDRRTPPENKQSHTVSPALGLAISCFILNISFYTVLILYHKKENYLRQIVLSICYSFYCVCLFYYGKQCVAHIL